MSDDYFAKRAQSIAPTHSEPKSASGGGGLVDQVKWSYDHYEFRHSGRSYIAEFRCVILDLAYKRFNYGKPSKHGPPVCHSYGVSLKDMVPDAGTDMRPGPCNKCPEECSLGTLVAAGSNLGGCEISRSLLVGMIDGDADSVPATFNLRGTAVAEVDRIMRSVPGGAAEALSCWWKFESIPRGGDGVKPGVALGAPLDDHEKAQYAVLAEAHEGVLAKYLSRPWNAGPTKVDPPPAAEPMPDKVDRRYINSVGVPRGSTLRDQAQKRIGDVISGKAAAAPMPFQKAKAEDASESLIQRGDAARMSRDEQKRKDNWPASKPLVQPYGVTKPPSAPPKAESDPDLTAKEQYEAFLGLDD